MSSRYSLLKCANVNGRAVDAEGSEERLHDDRRARNNEAADDRQFTSIGVAAPDGETAANDADRTEDEADEHDNAHRFACALRQAASGLGEYGSELKKCFHVAMFYRAIASTLLQRESDHLRRRLAFSKG